jgi:uncharacterized protein (TIGR03437 family)
MYATYLGSPVRSETDLLGDDAIASAVMDSAGHIWIGGSTNGTDWPVTRDAFQTSLQGDVDGFVAEFDPAGNKILYSTYYGTRGTNAVTGIAIDGRGRVAVAGFANSNRQNPYSVGDDFVAVLNGSGFEVVPMLRYGSDAGIAPTSGPAGWVTAGRGSVISFVQDSSDGGPRVSGIGNAAERKASGQVSPGELVTIAGSGLGPEGAVAARVAGGRIGDALGGVRVLFDDIAAPLLEVSANQIQAIVPFGLADQKETVLVVEYSGARSVGNRLGVVPATPAVFVTAEMNQYLPVAAALNEDGSVNSRWNPAAPGSMISIFGTGFGALTPPAADGSVLSGSMRRLQETVDIFGEGYVAPTYAGPAPGQPAGVMQVNFRLSKEPRAPETILLYAGGWPADFFSVLVAPPE